MYKALNIEEMLLLIFLFSFSGNNILHGILLSNSTAMFEGPCI
jgi:hypothetical protein